MMQTTSAYVESCFNTWFVNQLYSKGQNCPQEVPFCGKGDVDYTYKVGILQF